MLQCQGHRWWMTLAAVSVLWIAALPLVAGGGPAAAGQSTVEAAGDTPSGQDGHLAQDEESYVAHIHFDLCEDLDYILYHLSDVGLYHVEPTTEQAPDRVAMIVGTADVALTDLFDAPYSIHVHDGPTDRSTGVACAVIGDRPGDPWVPEDGLALELVEQNNSGHAGIAFLLPSPDGGISITLVLAESPGGDAPAAPPRPTYTNPTFGYSVTYDPSWEVDEQAASAVGADFVLTNGTSWVAFTATTEFGDDLERCVDDFAERRIGDPRLSNPVPTADESGEPLEGGTEATGPYAVYNHDYAFPDQAEGWTLYVRCTPISAGEVALAVVHNVRAVDYEEQAELREALFRGVALP